MNVQKLLLITAIALGALVLMERRSRKVQAVNSTPGNAVHETAEEIKDGLRRVSNAVNDAVY